MHKILSVILAVAPLGLTVVSLGFFLFAKDNSWWLVVGMACLTLAFYFSIKEKL